MNLPRRSRPRRQPLPAGFLMAVTLPALIGFAGVGFVTAAYHTTDPFASQPVWIQLPECGNGKCEVGEDATCPKDCRDETEPPPPGPVCGDGTCEGAETKVTCPADCGEVLPTDPICGNLICESGEDKNNCPGDCGDPLPTDPICGNLICEAGEDKNNCPADCGDVLPICGDGVCDEREKGVCLLDCPEPTPTGCGDGVCDDSEDATSCPADCLLPEPVCGDGLCSERERTEGSCPKDCGTPKPACGDGICESGERDTCPDDCPKATPTASQEPGDPTHDPPTPVPDTPEAQGTPGEPTDEPTPTIPSMVSTATAFPTPTPASSAPAERQPNCRFVRLDDLAPGVRAAFSLMAGDFEEVTGLWLVCERMPEEACIPIELAPENLRANDLRILNCTSQGTCTVHRLARYVDGQACGRAGRLRELTCLEGCTVVQGRLPVSFTPGRAIPMGLAIGLVGGFAGVIFVALSRGKRDLDEEFGDLYEPDLRGG